MTDGGKRYKSRAGKPIACVHCGHDRFVEGRALLNTRGFSFFDLDWLNRDAMTLTCTACGYIHWFAQKAREIGGSK